MTGPMKLSCLTDSQLAASLRRGQLCLHTGPFLSRIRTSIAGVIEGIALLYADYPIGLSEEFADFHIALTRPGGLRRWYRPQVNFELDGAAPFKPLPLDQALPFLEWGLNWCIGLHAHRFLIIHAAALERGGRAAILPGPPGAGKSTLTAFLVHNGWRLLSDELALVRLDDGHVTPLARPISLKNQSIDLIAQLLPGAVLSRKAHDTAKGTVALLKAPGEAIRRVAETAAPAWVVFPRFAAGAAARLEPRSKADILIELGENAFNYSIHGERGFEVLSSLVDRCDCYTFTYSKLDEALELFEAMCTREPAQARMGA
jgi:HprK-related kinase A